MDEKIQDIIVPCTTAHSFPRGCSSESGKQNNGPVQLLIMSPSCEFISPTGSLHIELCHDDRKMSEKDPLVEGEEEALGHEPNAHADL